MTWVLCVILVILDNHLVLGRLVTSDMEKFLRLGKTLQDPNSAPKRHLHLQVSPSLDIIH